MASQHENISDDDAELCVDKFMAAYNNAAEEDALVYTTARYILKLCSILHMNDIPTSLFIQQRATLEFSATEEVIQRAVVILNNFSLVQGRDTLSINRKIQNIVYWSSGSEQRREWCSTIAAALANENMDECYIRHGLRVLELFQANIECRRRLDVDSQQHIDIGYLISKIGEYLINNSTIKKSVHSDRSYPSSSVLFG